jgi:hypothetical protein
MDKNIIKQYLNKTFISEASSETASGTPGLRTSAKMAKDNAKINKAGVGEIGKDMKNYEKGLTKTDANEKTMATNKFNYNGDKEKTYHDEMEIMNGQMIQYDRTPSNTFKDRAMEAIEGSTRMGNNPEWANVVAKGQGGNPEFGKNLVKSIKASEKKRAEQTPTSKMFGNDWEVVPDKGHKSYAFEGTSGKPLIKENIEFDLKPITGQGDQLKNATHFAIHKATNGIASNWDYSDRMPKKPIPPKDKSNKRAVTIYNNKMAEYKEELKDINDEFRSAANDYFFYDLENNVGGNMDNFKKSDFIIVTRDGLAKRGIDLNNYKWFIGQKYDNTSSDSDLAKKGEEAMKGLDADYEKDSRAQQYKYNENDSINELSPELKRRAYFDSEDQAGYAHDAGKMGKFNKRRAQSDTFNSQVDPTLQPMGNKIVQKIDPTYKCIIWKSAEDNVVYVYFTPSDARNAPIAIRVDAKGHRVERGEELLNNVDMSFDKFLDKVQASEIAKINENKKTLQELNKKQTQTMKRLKFKKEFNGVGNALKLIPEAYKVDAKTFEMTDGNETYTIRWEGSLTEGKAVVLTAADKKMVNEDIEKMKHLFNYTSSSTLGTVKGKNRLDENKAFTNVWNKTKTLLAEAEEDEEDGEEEVQAPKGRKDAYDASLDVADPEDMEKSLSKKDIEKSTSEPSMINKDAASDDEDEDDMDIAQSNTELKLAKSTKTGEYAIITKINGKLTNAVNIPDEMAAEIKMGNMSMSKALAKMKTDKEDGEMSDEELMEAIMKMTDGNKKK